MTLLRLGKSGFQILELLVSRSVFSAQATHCFDGVGGIRVKVRLAVVGCLPWLATIVVEEQYLNKPSQAVVGEE